jgi:hypothetical protein
VRQETEQGGAKLGMIFIDTIELDERLASHLVGLDPLLRDQLGFRLSDSGTRL